MKETLNEKNLEGDIKKLKEDISENNKNNYEDVIKDINDQELDKSKGDLEQHKEGILEEQKIKKINSIDKMIGDIDKKVKGKEGIDAPKDLFETEISGVALLLKDKGGFEEYIISLSEYKQALIDSVAKENLIKKIDSFFDISYRLHGQGSIGRVSPKRYFGIFSEVIHRNKDYQEFDIIHDTYVKMLNNLLG